jgi:hypothetical protein
MRADLIKAIVEALPDNELIVTYWFDKEQANDLAEQHDEELLTDAEWLAIWEKMSKDKQLNQMADELFDELFWQTIKARKG